MHKPGLLVALVMALVLFLAACNSGLPSQPGEYEIQPKSITYDGENYEVFWIDKNQVVHHASGDDIKLMQDSRTFLEMRGDEAIIHLASEESIVVQAEDDDGNFTSFWYPFWIGRMTADPGRPVIINQPYGGSPPVSPGQPTYHYPPASSFGRGETLHGSTTNPGPSAPDYRRVAPAPHAVGGQAGGTGGGTAATDKGAGTTPQLGQKGGTGAGTAASGKGGLKSGGSSFKSNGSSSSGGKVGAGSGKSSSGSKGGSGGSSRSSGGRGGRR